MNWLKILELHVLNYLRGVGQYELGKMGITPLNNKEDNMSDAPAKTRRPRVPKVPAKTEILRQQLSVGETVKLYRLLDRARNHSGTYKLAVYAEQLFETYTGGAAPLDAEIGFDTRNTTRPQIVALITPPEPVKKPRQPRKPKATVDLPATAAPAKRQPRKLIKTE